jgi:two-component system sensor histidine kinase KdpD
LRFPPTVSRLAPEQRRLAEAMAEDIAQAALRTRLVADLEDRACQQRDRATAFGPALVGVARPALAAASMIGSAEQSGQLWRCDGCRRPPQPARDHPVEGERLDRYIQNLLDMTRLGHDGLTLNRDWIGVDELIGSAATRLQRYEPDVQFEVRVPASLAPIWVHPALVEQALFNVIENAAKFSSRAKPS